MTTTDNRPLRRDAQINRDRIIRAAQEVFAERGLAGTFHDIADRAGVGLGTVYRRFPTKEELVEVVFAQRLAEFIATVEAALQIPSGWDGLVTVLSTAAGMYAEDRGLRDLALGHGFGPQHFENMSDQLEPLLRRLVARAQDEGTLRPDVTADDLPILLTMLSEVAHHGNSVRPGLHTRYLNLILAGLRNPTFAQDLGEPLNREQLDAIAGRWLPRISSRDHETSDA
ncbi:TetR/AcrR family transcriptional regulator [Paractinoplanes atraurantiacus]|uniref:DNA-binding transcriptional regulator, AcrR family n=1 Tax=Paractinoplanes atraurantiacus TaxID=1036182 RepID=A0A285H714_9ACTN|nr:TetR/AcrR family transcriptional regulator [Actinoplanes atraurantiacus]SNY31343.1 DNA-binding transcriptional regulator, AcrR family [Actinoplanes atraurantiacus]